MSASISALVVDDEPAARQRLMRCLKSDPDIRLVGACGSADEAAAHARSFGPELLILDVRLPGRDGFDLLNALSHQGVHPFVIFVTGHGDRSLDAFEAGAIDYLVKPFDEARLARALARAKSLIASGARGKSPAPDEPSAFARAPSRLLLTERGKVIVLLTRDIEFVQASGKVLKIYAGGRCFLHRQALRQLEARLDPSRFVRVHRSTVVNVEHIAEIHPLFHGDYELTLRRGTRLTLSRRFRARLKPFLLT